MTAPMTILGDIGATNARFALFDGCTTGPISTFNVHDFATPIEALRRFISTAADAPPAAAIIAAAGPVAGERIVMTNAPWIVDGPSIRDALGLAATLILNDFAALAWSLPELSAGDLRQIGGGVAAAGAVRAVLGPGTGFGLAGFVAGAREEIVLVTEGGHATLAGDTARDDAVIAFLRRKFGHVSIERALSGGGLAALCEAVVAVDGLARVERDAAGVVHHALAGGCEASEAALALFCELLGTVAGNVALTLGARGGVFIGGGMVPRFVDFLARSPFRERFEGKGRLAAYLAAIPTAVIVHPHPTFLGLARLARRMGGPLGPV